MKIYIATSNAHKVTEFSQMFKKSGIDCQVYCSADIKGFESPVEDGHSFLENAFIKADALKAEAPADAYVFADDSGIVVDALSGAPGIHSARYAGIDGKDSDLANNALLLKNLENVQDCKRTARFICCIALITPDGDRYSFDGKIEGVINHGESGVNGFGYDPLFLLPERGITTAELDSEEKNEISHRGIAFKKLTDFLLEVN